MKMLAAVQKARMLGFCVPELLHRKDSAMHREKYIEEQLRKRLGKRRDSEEGEGEENGNAEEDDLYTIPANLQVCLCPGLPRLARSRHRQALNRL